MKTIVRRPWGSYLVLGKSKNFLIKKIIVKPEGVLSYQSHKFRSEHWIIIEGKATVIIIIVHFIDQKMKIYSYLKKQNIGFK